MVDPKLLVEAGVHFGHRTDRWHPKMKPYILEARNGVHLINVEKTAQLLEKACRFLREVAARGEKVLFVGCKKQAQGLVEELAKKTDSFYVKERWLGGMLTNLATIRKSVGRLRWIEELEAKGLLEQMPKKEVSSLRREAARLRRSLDGIRDMERLPGAVILVDVVKEAIAVHEARRCRVPSIGIVDTNGNPELVDIPIPGNDDSIRSLRALLEPLAQAILEGRSEGSPHESSELATVEP
ncbi:30S ribosomal protein S2 [Candidatus Methylacidithermus pantelleriae]|uniref:Small ribosomal subunit protein uS2 n=1 Tax=Candidatus Methylacidithermus pantelleriae TaxID=2744239 RepID=A0A8J2BJF3_9BACT|nr:30S ribosomal protein S2 [Candidatus Methylacidithermus pantelleriae]CAF0689486.1 30S ribosomal subunit protein S2 [Candidatus Methylacidithermus pantelleriae]